MRFLSVLIIVTLSQGVFAPEYSWFEQNWETSLELMAIHNPEHLGVDEESAQDLRNIHPMRWKVDGGLLTVIHSDGSTHTSPYSIRPVDQLTFELIFTDVGEGTTFLIHRNETGFCSRLKPFWTNLELGEDEETPRDYTGALEVNITLKDCFQPSSS